MMLLLLALTAAAATDEEVYAAWESGELLTAARLADERLAERPRSLHANFVKGYVLWREEGEHAAARHYLEKADDIYWKVNPSNDADGPWQVHNEVMQARIDVAAEMDDAEHQLELIDRYNELFSPDIDSGRAWPLMKRGRFAAARAAAQLGVDSDDWWKQSSGLNSLCAIESEAMNRAEGWRWCKAAVEHERSAEFPDPTVDANNASSSALGVLDFEAALRLAKEATTGSPNNISNPHGTLVAHYIRMGRGSDAISAVEGMVAWRSHQPANYRDLARSGSDALLARFLYAAGRAERARELIDRAIQFPDRAGLTSSDPLQAEGRHAALRLAVRRLEREAAAEHRATQGLLTRSSEWLGSWLPDSGVWEDRATLRAALIDDRRARATFLVYMEGGLGIEPWSLALMSEDVGYGVFVTEVERARSTDAKAAADLPSLAGLDAYYDALTASAAFSHGDWSTVDELAASAFAGLPADEVLLRAQLAAIVAESAWRSGQSDEALQWFA
ncbi:MAG: hypothetical protein KC912_26810, partial [Proteobacteria bacterium]|nr:hypothetical protein [Pseudomonadota bacterium]